jgi:hypothetical protein
MEYYSAMNFHILCIFIPLLGSVLEDIQQISIINKLEYKLSMRLNIYLFIYWWDWGSLPLEPHLQSFLPGCFGDAGGLMNYLSGLALDQDPPDLSHLNS